LFTQPFAFGLVCPVLARRASTAIFILLCFQGGLADFPEKS
jgi:hypothetical protein